MDKCMETTCGTCPEYAISPNCPFCGAEPETVVEWKDGKSYVYACGTEQTPGGFYRNDQCYETELAALQQRLQELENLYHQCCKDNVVLRTRLEALEKWGRDALKIIEVVATAEQHGNSETNHYIFRRFGMKTKAQISLKQARTLGLVEG